MIATALALIVYGCWQSHTVDPCGTPCSLHGENAAGAMDTLTSFPSLRGVPRQRTGFCGTVETTDMINYLPQIILLAGLIIWLASDRAKLSEAGRLMFFAGLLATCLMGVRW